MSEEDITRIPDGGVLRTLPSGLQIVRRRKHEWFPALATFDPMRLKDRTGKKWGSKFLPAWTLIVLTDWIAMRVTETNWTTDIQEPEPLDTSFGEPIGLANGVGVHTIRIVCDGRYIHAYPI